MGRERSGVLGESVTKRHKVGEGPRQGECHRDEILGEERDLRER